jgi:competence protein ComEC
LALAALDGAETAARAAGWVARAGATALVESARLVDAAPMLSRRVPPPGVPIVAVYYAGLAAALVPRVRVRLTGVCLLGASWVVIVSGATAAWTGDSGLFGRPALRLTVFDVGQSEAMLLEVPRTKPLVIDSGGVPFGEGGIDVARRVLAPALWARGILTVDTLLITHGDPDHIGGAPAVIGDFRPRRLWTGVPVPAHAPSLELFDIATRAGIVRDSVRQGHERQWGDARIRVLHPPEPDWERQRVRNDDSVVLEVLYGDAAILLTGDISAEIERRILPRLTPARIRILKVAHHGSRTSSSRELLEGWRPQLAVISCGRGNSFGHPTRDVLERLETAGAQVLRTDRDGQITIETDGREVRVRTFL